ncbi:FadR/GntR family transcriptional regulator [Kocuria turfanensis]|uniref:GntR family transcriptional regulator n=1 Tax=Kocuria turfanensis TaxID=388357 RepID=A0A512IEZ2_9MICC|nr:FadR/GntR family transcriptional regulator [Kocuria turfanensis]GEO96238.1 GntR family transcriptional regulator [Kocuria turfanensis]
MSHNLTTALVDDLRARIVDGRIAPGERLPSESSLITEHGVSRTVVREAVARLQAEGLVHTRRGSGSFALTPPAAPAGSGRPVRTLRDRRSLLAFRTGVESEAAALAATARDEQQLARMEQALLRTEQDADHPAAALEHDFEFHRTVAEASHNPYYVDALTGLGPAMITMPPRRLDGAAGTGGRTARVLAEHRAVLDAIRAGDPLAASAAMRVHLANSLWRLEAEAGSPLSRTAVPVED